MFDGQMVKEGGVRFNLPAETGRNHEQTYLRSNIAIAFFMNDLGELIIAYLSPDSYEEVSRADLVEPDQDIGNRKVVWSHPAFAKKCIDLRNEHEILCYGLAALAEQATSASSSLALHKHSFS